MPKIGPVRLSVPKAPEDLTNRVRYAHTAMIAGLAAGIAMLEIERLISSATWTDQQTARVYSASFHQVLLPGAAWNVRNWNVWAAAEDHREVAEWIRIHSIIEILGVAGAVIAALVIYLPGPAIARRLVIAALAFVGIEALWSIYCAQRIARGDGRDPFDYVAWEAVFAAVVTSLKWLLVLGAVVALWRNKDVRRTVPSVARVLGRSGWAQRLSVVAIGTLGSLLLVPMRGVFDQLPDVVRSWFYSGWVGVVHGLAALVAVGLVFLLLLIIGRRRAALEYLDPASLDSDPRYRWWLTPPAVVTLLAVGVAAWASFGVKRAASDFVDRQILAYLLAIPVVLVAASMSVRVFTDTADRRAGSDSAPEFPWLPAGGFWVVVAGSATAGWLWFGVWGLLAASAPFLLASAGRLAGLTSLWWRQRRPERIAQQASEPEESEPEPKTRAKQARMVSLVGDSLALALPATFVLALLRSLIAPVLYLDGGWPRGAMVLVLGLAVVATVGLIWSARLVEWVPEPSTTSGAPIWHPAHQLWALDPQEQDEAGKSHRAIVVLVMTLCAGMIISVVLGPEIPGHLGVVATTILGVGIWATVLGGFIIGTQRSQPLELFRLFRMKANPVLTVAVVAALIFGTFADPDRHAVQLRPLAASGDDGSRPDRRLQLDSLHEEFGNWLARSAVCDRPVPQSTDKVRPMLLVAASGGGVRAAEWTAGTFAAMAATGDCGSAATLLSSGASGGALGLAVAASAPKPSGAHGASENPLVRVEKLDDPGVLSIAVSGVLVRDLFAAVTGLRVPDWAGFRGDRDRQYWRDRAALIEDRWSQDVVGLAEPFYRDVSPEPGAPAAPVQRGSTGALVFNATSATTGCRVQLTQVRLDQNPRVGGDRKEPEDGDDCTLDDGRPAASSDLLALVGNTSEGKPDKCPLDNLSLATAAGISARFAYVTPTARLGVADRCAAHSLQLIDGGYAEGSGLGTIADIAPRLASIVTEHNQAVGSGMAGPYVVPLVLYLDDEPGSDLARRTRPPLSESSAPVAVGRAPAAELASSNSLAQRVVNTMSLTCPVEVANSACWTARRFVLDELVNKPVEDPKVATSAMPRIEDPGGSLVVVSPPTTPGVRAPLGWVMSELSRESLREPLRVARTSASQSTCEKDSGRSDLCHLLMLLQGN